MVEPFRLPPDVLTIMKALYTVEVFRCSRVTFLSSTSAFTTERKVRGQGTSRSWEKKLGLPPTVDRPLLLPVEDLVVLDDSVPLLQWDLLPGKFDLWPPLLYVYFRNHQGSYGQKTNKQTNMSMLSFFRSIFFMTSVLDGRPILFRPRSVYRDLIRVGLLARD